MGWETSRIEKIKKGDEGEPQWLRRIEDDITNLRKDINLLERGERREIRGSGKKEI